MNSNQIPGTPKAFSASLETIIFIAPLLVAALLPWGFLAGGLGVAIAGLLMVCMLILPWLSFTHLPKFLLFAWPFCVALAHLFYLGSTGFYEEISVFRMDAFFVLGGLGGYILYCCIPAVFYWARK